MNSFQKTQVTIWMLGVLGAGLWMAPGGIALADTASSVQQEDRYTQYLKEKLSLTDAQVTQVQSILNNANTQLGPKPLESANAVERDAYNQKLRDSMQNTQTSISNVLTDDQKSKFTQLKQNHENRGEHKHHRHDRSGGFWQNNQTPVNQN